MTTTTARMTVRKGNLADMPKLLPGEFGLATDIQRANPNKYTKST